MNLPDSTLEEIEQLRMRYDRCKRLRDGYARECEDCLTVIDSLLNREILLSRVEELEARFPEMKNKW